MFAAIKDSAVCLYRCHPATVTGNGLDAITEGTTVPQYPAQQWQNIDLQMIYHQRCVLIINLKYTILKVRYIIHHRQIRKGLLFGITTCTVQKNKFWTEK